MGTLYKKATSWLAALSLMCGGAVAATATTSTQAQASESVAHTVESGTLTWGFKDSFRNYIMNFKMFEGRANIIKPATNAPYVSAGNAKDTIIVDYPVVAGNDFNSAAPGLVSASGGIRYQSHPQNSEYILDLTLENPQISFNGSSASISVDVKGRKFVDTSTLGDYQTFGRTTIARFASVTPVLSNNTATYTLAKGSITEGGKKVLGGSFYEVGDPVDDATLSLTLKAKEMPAVLASSASSVEQGKELTFTASGYQPGEKVAFVLAPKTFLGLEVANDQGVATKTWTVSRDTTVGEQTLTATGAITKKSARATFAVTEKSGDEPVNPSNPEPTLPEYRIDWSMKSSFVNSGYMKAGYSATEPAVLHEGVTYFPVTAESQAFSTDNPADVTAQGCIKLYAHGGIMDITVCNPRVSFTGGKASVKADTYSKELVDPEMKELPFAEFAGYSVEENGDSVTVTLTGGFFTDEGGKAFGRYNHETSVDDLVLHLKKADKGSAPEDPDTPADPSDPITPSNPDEPLDPSDPEKPKQEAVSVSAKSVPQGANITFTATGFTPGEDVTFVVHSTPITIGTVTADKQGTASISWAIPVGFEVGNHSVVATGAQSKVRVEDAFYVSTALVPAQPQQPQPVVDTSKKCAVNGTLAWGVKDSFNTYVQGAIAQGSISLGSGASGKFNWPLTGGKYDTKARQGSFYFGGSVHYTGHGGKLDVTFSNPVLAVNGNSGTLYLTASTSDTSGNKTNLGQVAFANVALSSVNVTDSAFSIASSSVTLTDAGARAFATFYQAGQQLNSLSASGSVRNCQFIDANGKLVERDAFGNEGAPGSGTLAKTGSATSTAMAVSLVLTFAGAVFVCARKRSARTCR